MGKQRVIKLTDGDVERIVKKIVNESHREENYMFFQNLREIKSNIDELLEMDEAEIDMTISDGHDWASEHIATAKDDIEEVLSFFKHRKK